MTDPIANLIAAAERSIAAYRSPQATHSDAVDCICALEGAIAAAKAAAESRPEPKLDDACDFYGRLPKGPNHGRFSASDRAELDSLKRKAFESARPEPAAEPSEVDRLMRMARKEATSAYQVLMADAFAALAREVRRG